MIVARLIVYEHVNALVQRNRFLNHAVLHQRSSFARHKVIALSRLLPSLARRLQNRSAACVFSTALSWLRLGSIYRCNSDDDYTYSGPKCEDSEMSKAKVVAIVGGVLGAFCALFLIIIIIICWRRRGGDSQRK